MKTNLLAVFAFFLNTTIFAQTNITEADVAYFIPKNYYVVKLAQGNFNDDNIPDAILVLGKKGEDSLSTLEHPIKRKCLVLFGAANKKYTLVAQNSNIVCYYSYDPNFRDAFVDARIENKLFIVEHYGGFAQRWGRTSTFQYNPADKIIYLIKDEHSTFDATDVDKTLQEKTYTQKNFGKIPFDKFNVYNTVK